MISYSKSSKINLYLIDMSEATNTSGVDRYVDTLVHGLQSYTDIKIHWIHLRRDSELLFPREEQVEECIKYTIPLPQQYNDLISEQFWMRKYNEQVYRLTKHLFNSKENCIIHLHTLNLIDLATYIRENTGCKVITHLHCIPWKGLYNCDKKRFNMLYKITYINKEKEVANPEMYLIGNCELRSYVKPDALICVTQCAVDFLKTCIHTRTANIKVIPNGINDLSKHLERRLTKIKNDSFRCLYVGVVSESKGVMYILKALNLVKQQGYNVSLSIAGACSPTFRQKIVQDFPNIEVNVLGRVSFDQLKMLYLQSDIGIIASLQEQASYVAIEMAMFGLPIVTTAVDGLDEIFTDDVNALKVGTKFSSVLGLSVDIEMMANQIVRLLENSKLRDKLSQNVRKLYKKELNIELMLQKTVDLYQSV